MLQKQPCLPNQFHGLRHHQLPVGDPLRHGRTGVDAQRQQRDIVRPHGVQSCGGIDRMSLPIPVGPGKAVDGGDGQGESGGFQLLPGLNLLGRRDALVDFFQQGVVAGLKAQIREVQPRRPEGGQVLRRLLQDALGACIGGDPLAFGKQLPDVAQNFQQLRRGENQRVSVGQKEAFHAWVLRPRPAQVLQHLTDRGDGELLCLIHIAKGTLVVAASHSHLDDQAMGFAGGAVDGSGIVQHGRPPF
ncbi:hypothetical protein SDC9_129499 [bioreactor metagenome]|uniref:Uncharacterized protein n=1 Tax=bioreactor metagenome TaxID=1076179 RepID=A0A645D002_9ZZZZ